MPDIIITPSTGKLEFVDLSAQVTRRHSFTLDANNGLNLDSPLSAAAISAPLNVINVTVDNSNVNYPFVLAQSGETGAKNLLMDGAGGTYNPFTNTATIDISGNAATATNSTQLNGQAASYYTNIPARLGYTPVNQAGDTITGNVVINGNFTVTGATTLFSASSVYISSSQLVVDDNIITLNAFSPYLRYTGIEMIDSGSATTSSILWDSQNDYFFLTGSGINGKIIVGPDQQGSLTSTKIPKATGTNILGDSIITDNGSSISIGGSITATNLSGTNTGDQTIGDATLTVAAGSGISLSATPTFTANATTNKTITVSNSGVTSVTGTSNQVSVSAATGGVTFSLPQNIHTAASPTFAGATLNGQLNVNHSVSTAIVRLWNAGSTIWSLGVNDAQGSYFNISADFGSILINKTNGNIWISGSGINNTVLHNNSTLPAGNLSGTIPAGVLSNSSLFIGTSQIALNRASGAQTLNGVSIDGNAATSTIVNGTNGQLLFKDIRAIAPNNIAAGYLQFGFTTWTNTLSTTPYADYLHLRSYTDSSGGNDNLVMFRKDVIGMRIWQQSFGSATNYSTYKDVAFTDQIGNGTITIAAGTGVGVGTSNTFTTNQSGATTVTISNTGVTSVAGTTNQVSVSAGTGAVTFSLPQNIHTAATPTFASITTSADGANITMAGSANAEGIRMTPASSTTYPVFLRSFNPGVGEASPWIYKEQATDWGIWHNNPVNSIDFTKQGSGGIASNVGGSSTNTVTVRVEMATGFVQTIAGYRNSAGTTILDNSGNISGNSATATILQTARNIGGVSFNGSADINLPGVNTAGNQNTSGNAATATTATNANAISFTEVELNAPVTVSGTWNTGNGSDWGEPKFGTSFNQYRYADGDGPYVEYNIPANHHSCFISQLQWSSGGYADCHGVQSDGDLVFLRRINTRQLIENSNHGNTVQHDGATVTFAGSGLQAFTKIRITNRLGRIHMTGIAFTRQIDDGYEGTGMVHPAQISHQGSGSGLDADLLDGYNSATANTVNTIVLRDASGNFSAGTITATLSGTATTATTANALNTSNSYTGVNFTATGFFQTNLGQIKSDTSFALLTTSNGAQSVSVKGILLGTSYDTAPGANEIRTTNNTSLYLNARGTGDIQFQTADSLKMMLLNNGNVGIGTSNPSRKLDVEGIVRTRGASGTGGFEIGAATTGAARWRIEWDSASDSLDFNWVA